MLIKKIILQSKETSEFRPHLKYFHSLNIMIPEIVQTIYDYKYAYGNLNNLLLRQSRTTK